MIDRETRVPIEAAARIKKLTAAELHAKAQKKLSRAERETINARLAVELKGDFLAAIHDLGGPKKVFVDLYRRVPTVFASLLADAMREGMQQGQSGAAGLQVVVQVVSPEHAIAMPGVLNSPIAGAVIPLRGSSDLAQVIEAREA